MSSEQKPIKQQNRLSRLFNSVRGRKDKPKTTESQQPGAASTTPAPAGQQSVAAAARPAVIKATAAASNEALAVKLRNHTAFNTVFCYITGTEVDTGRLVLLQADGANWYYPDSPSSTLQPLAVDCNIVMPAPKQTRQITIPSYVAGARIWFSQERQLSFFINPGPGLVEPSVTNPSDPNYGIFWSFAEFTYTSAQMFMNISYVDFVSAPIALNLFPRDGSATQHVAGMNQDGLQNVSNGLNQQNSVDGAGWNQLSVYGSNGNLLRVLSPNSGRALNANLLSNYWDGYINAVYDKYTNQDLVVNTQAGYGNPAGRVQNGTLFFGSTGFQKPTSADVWSNSTGPFAVTQPSTQQIAIIPRLAAAFNRSTLLLNAAQPDGVPVSEFYQANPTNYYSKIVHQNNLDQLGYAFPYDDVTGDGQQNQAGVVQGQARLMVIAYGGIGAGLGPAPEDDNVAAGAA